MADEPRWKESVRQQMETELSQRVRDALETPPLERLQKRNDQAKQRLSGDINSQLLIDLSVKERELLRSKHWKTLQAKKVRDKRELSFVSHKNVEMQFLFRDELSASNHDQYPGVFGLGNLSEGIKNIRDDYSVSISRYPGAKPKLRHFYTKEGFLKALRSGNLPNGVQFIDDRGTYVDKYGVVRNGDGPFWPVESVPMFPTPRFKWWTEFGIEPFSHHLPPTSNTVDNQITPYKGKWRGVQVIFDSERSPRDFSTLSVPEGCCPSLGFESRFECGNLRQARRIGQFEYELVLKPDLYTARHTQWYYFRVTHVVPRITYKFRIVNLLKKDSLYNHGMRPLLYSEKDANENKKGWHRVGHHISYSRNITNHNCPLLQRGVSYFMLEWQMEFQHAEDTYYLAHCYPYSFTDLKEDLEVLMNSEERAKVTRREVMCETRAGNSCFLLTVSNFNMKEPKKAVVVTARVHPGESQASWMMKGLLEFITGPDKVAQELRNNFVFKIVPMINPDGVIVGNYRCSLAARDLNRNYRHPRRENFPTVWYLKNMMEDLSRKYEIALYCDLHGHSRKPNIFMYGNNTSTEGEPSALGMARAFISERLFPWLMSERSPDKFAFKSCKFSVRRCKESTGRVVMWRQMGVFNSFTLEATFSGTVLEKDKCRHFNILDFMGMGKVLAQTVLDYSKVQDDETQQTQTVLDLTRVITEQILVSKGLIEPDSVLPDFGVDKGMVETDSAKVRESAEKWTGALLQLLNTPKKETGKTDNTAMLSKTDIDEQSNGLIYTHDDVVTMLGKMTGKGYKSMEDCLGILAQIEAHENFEESDSSDSDSESEPEMKAAESKPRKKKKKSKKQRDHDKKGDRKQEETRTKSSSALPSLSANQRQGGSNSANSDNLSMGKKQANPDKSGISTTGQSNAKPMSAYISKYEGRHNGGVPCFTEERSMERAAKRMAEMRKKHEDDPNRDVTFYCVDDNGVHTLSQEELNQRLLDLANPSTSSPASPMMGFNVKTGYTHANNLQELAPSPHPTLTNNMASLLMSSMGGHHHKHHFNFHDFPDHSSSDECESEYSTTSINGKSNDSANNHSSNSSGRSFHTKKNSRRSSSNRNSGGGSNGSSSSNKISSFAFSIAAKKNPYQHLDPVEESPKSSPRVSHTSNANTASRAVISMQNNPITSKCQNSYHPQQCRNNNITEQNKDDNEFDHTQYLSKLKLGWSNNSFTNNFNVLPTTTATKSQSPQAAMPRKDASSHYTKIFGNDRKTGVENRSIKKSNVNLLTDLSDYRNLKRSKTQTHLTESSSPSIYKRSSLSSVSAFHSPAMFNKNDLKIDLINGATVNKHSPPINGSFINNQSGKKSQHPTNVGKLVQQLSNNLVDGTVSSQIPIPAKRLIHVNQNTPHGNQSRSSHHVLSNSSSPLMTASFNPANRMPLPDATSPRIEDKFRIGGKSTNYLTRSHRPSPNGAQQEFSWE